MAANLLQIAPILLVHDMKSNIDYWVEKVGFEYETYGEPIHTAFVWRGSARIMLQIAPPDAPLTPNWKLAEKTSNLFIWVDDAKALFEEVKTRGAEIDWGLYTAPWGGLEFGIQDPQGHDIAFGQILKQTDKKEKA